MKRSISSWWLFAAGVLVFLLGVYDELFAGFLREGCRTGVADACERVPFVTARAHAISIVGVATICLAMARGIRRRLSRQSEVR